MIKLPASFVGIKGWPTPLNLAFKGSSNDSSNPLLVIAFTTGDGDGDDADNIGFLYDPLIYSVHRLKLHHMDSKQ